MTLNDAATSSTAQLPLHIDSTMMSCFRQCPQKYFNEFVLGLRPPGLSIDLHAGACFANALEQTYKGVWLEERPLHDALLRAEARFFTEWGDVEAPEWKRTAKTKDRVWEAVESYFSTYSPLTDHVRPYFGADGKPTFEFTFAIPLEPVADTPNGGLGDHHRYFPRHPSGEAFLYCGRFDMLGQYQDRPCFRDEKTTGASIGSNWASNWDLRSQFIGYTWACQQLGIDLETGIIRGIAIQKTQITHAEAIKTYGRHLVAQWYEQLRRDMWRLRRAWDEQYFDFNLGEACVSYGQCPFMSVCGSPNPDSWRTEFEVRHWNPLNKGKAEKAEAA